MNSNTDELTLFSKISDCSAINKRFIKPLGQLSIQLIRDFCFHFPVEYEDRTKRTKIAQLDDQKSAVFAGQLSNIEIKSYKNRYRLTANLLDESGVVHLSFFNLYFNQIKLIKSAKFLQCWGKLGAQHPQKTVFHPEYRAIEDLNKIQLETTLSPIYLLTKGISQLSMRKISTLLFNQLPPTTWMDCLAKVDELKKQTWPSLSSCFKTLHFPTLSNIQQASDRRSPIWKRLATEEMALHRFSAKDMRLKKNAQSFVVDQKDYQKLLGALSFELTDDQQKAIQQIYSDLQTTKAMRRTVVGDVGSGKTVVALFAALPIFQAGRQVALLVPTEVLAHQHFERLSVYLKLFNKKATFLCASMTTKEKSCIYEKIARGDVHLIIGTHALFQEALNYEKLRLVIIDEQHRFGVTQRYNMVKKSGKQAIHFLMMSATPIPRTLSMIKQAYLDYSLIKSLPSGRKKTTVHVMPNDKRTALLKRLKAQLDAGEQVFWVCPLIDDAQDEQKNTRLQALLSLESIIDQLIDPSRVGVLHGQMKAKQKQTIIGAFKNHQIDLLLTTTIVEVGIDIPNANMIVIENAERLGLSQLHQLRGRVGRGDANGICILLYQKPLSEKGQSRLKILKSIDDGFELAAMDLKMRGAGTLLGNKQTGTTLFKCTSDQQAESLVDLSIQLASMIESLPKQSINWLKKFWLGNQGQPIEYDKYL